MENAVNKLFGVGGDPVNEVADFGVDTWVSWLSTSVSPADNTSEVFTIVVSDQWATRVSYKLK